VPNCAKSLKCSQLIDSLLSRAGITDIEDLILLFELAISKTQLLLLLTLTSTDETL